MKYPVFLRCSAWILALSEQFFVSNLKIFSFFQYRPGLPRKGQREKGKCNISIFKLVWGTDSKDKGGDLPTVTAEGGGDKK
jgi:hypothetical protein